MDYVENLLQSIDQVVYHRLRDQKFDETIVCTITDTSKASRGLYVVSDGTIKFDAYSELTDYKVDEAVRVNIPKGDYSQKKYIIGRSVSEKNGNQPIVYNSPSAEILDISGNLCTNTKAKIIANGGVKEVLIWSNERLSEDYANSIYDSILIAAQFQTFFSPYNISQGAYGLRLKVIIAPKKASDKIICREYDLDSRDMFGDPYNYLLPSTQEVKFNFDVNENIQQMSLYLYQNDDFIYKTNTGAEQRLGMALAENIHVSNVHIGLGTNLSTIEDNTVKIYTDDDLTYNSINGTNQKAIRLIWYNKDDNHRYVGFSDGVVDASYDEMNYDKNMSNHNRLMVQASQGNIPDDYAGFELGARMSEIGNINTSLKQLIDKDLYSNLKKFKNALAPTNNDNIVNPIQEIIDYIEYENQGQAILTQLDNLYNFYSLSLNFAAAASQGKLYYQADDEKYYIIKDLLDLAQREEISPVGGSLSIFENSLFGTLNDDNWETISPSGSIGLLLLIVSNQLNSINHEVKTKAANYLSVCNNWQKKIGDILDKIKINTLRIQKISVGQSYLMYPLGQNINNTIESHPTEAYSSKDLLELDNVTEYCKGLLKRIITPSSDSGFCEFLHQTYSDIDTTSNDNKYQIYWYYERNGYSPGEEENSYGGPGWCEIEDNGSVNDVGRFTILNTEIQNDEEVIVKNIGLPKPTEEEPNKYPTKPDENDQNGYLSISFSSNRPDIKEEKIKCVVIYNHEKYESNILTFKNEDPAAGPELTNAIQLVHGKNSRDIYACYNADNTLTNASDKVTPRELKIEYLNERGEPETGEDSTLIGSTVYWYVPTGVTMLTVDDGDLSIGDDSVEDFECGSAVDRTYQILKSVKSVKCNNTIPMFTSGGYWKRAGDAWTHQYPWLVFNDAGTQVTFYIKSDLGVEEITQNISSSTFYYGDDSYEVVFNSPLLQYTTSRALQKGDGDIYYYTYQGVNYAKTESPSDNCILEEGLNNIINLIFQYTIEDLVYGGIIYKFSDDSKQIVSSNEKKYVIRNNQVTLPVDDPDQYDREGFAYYYKTINSIDDLTFKYRIKEHYSQSFVNNIILCKVVKNNRVLEDSKTFTFSSQGVNGTNYSLVINAEDGAHTFFNNKYNFSISLFDYDGNQIPFTAQPKVKFYNDTPIELQKTLSNENGVLVYKGTIELINIDKNDPNHLIVTTTQPWPINSNIVPDNADNTPVKSADTITLEKIQPIAYAQDTKYIAEVPTEIIYNSSGSDPSYYKEPLRLYEKQPNGDLQLVSDGYWIIVNNTNNSYLPVLEGQTLSDSEPKKYKNGLVSLKPLNMYVTTQEGFDFCILQYRSNENTILWSQPIVIMQNRFPSTLLNNWDGSLQINTKDGTILSNLVGAGQKNDDNEFSGVLMGDIDKSDIDNTNGGVFLNPHTGMGLYGFHNGAQSFGFNVDGTAFIGRSGGGRVAFDGNQGYIYSANWLLNKKDNNTPRPNPFKKIDGLLAPGNQGMIIDLENGHIDAYNFKLSSKGIQLNGSPNDDESYFLIGEKSDNNSTSYLEYSVNGGLVVSVNDLRLTGTIGGPNLLNNTAPWFYNKSNNYVDSWVGDGNTSPEYAVYDQKSCIRMTSPYMYQYISYPSYFDKGKYIFSCEVYNASQQMVTLTMTLGLSSEKQLAQQCNLINEEWTKVIFFFDVSDLNLIRQRVQLEHNSNGPDLYLYHMKLERGTMVTDWCSSTQDNEQKNLQNVDSQLNKDKYVFNKLTKNGTLKGLYMTDIDGDGKEELYINADYIQTGALTIGKDNNEIFYANINDPTVRIGGWEVSPEGLKIGEYFGQDNFIGLYTADQYGTAAGKYLYNWRMVIGKNFGVTSDGSLYANSAHLSGIINALEGGSIGPWNITADGIQAGASYIAANGGFSFNVTNPNQSLNYVQFQPPAYNDYSSKTRLFVGADIVVTEGHHIYVGSTQIA